jgi:hypothetical protein
MKDQSDTGGFASGWLAAASPAAATKTATFVAFLCNFASQLVQIPALPTRDPLRLNVGTAIHRF